MMKFKLFEFDKLLDRRFTNLIALICLLILSSIILFLYSLSIETPGAVLLLLVISCGLISYIPHFKKRTTAGFLVLNNSEIFINDIKINLNEIKFIEVNYYLFGYEGKRWFLTFVVETGLNEIRIVTDKADYKYLFLSTKKSDVKFLKSYRKLLKENGVPCKIRTGLWW